MATLTMRTTGALAFLLGAAAMAVAAPVAIVDPGFEQPLLGNNQFERFSQQGAAGTFASPPWPSANTPPDATPLYTAWPAIPGWTAVGTLTDVGIQNFVGSADWVAGTFVDGPDVNTAGTNEQSLFIAGTRYAIVQPVVSQTLAETLQANTRYTLSVDVGDRPGITGWQLEAGYTAELWAGGVLVAQATGFAPVNPTTGGTFTNISVDFDTLNDPLPAGAALGSALQIRLKNSAFNTTGNPQIIFDNVALDASPAVAINQWEGPGGGNFNTAGNWTGSTVPTGGSVAVFRQQITAPSTVTLTSGVTLDSIELTNVANSYTLAGAGAITLTGSATIDVTGNHTISAPIAGTSGLNKTGTGTLALSGNNSYTGATTIGKASVLTVNSLANGGVNSSIGASSSDAANLVIDAGTLRYVGAAATTDRLFTLGRYETTLDASGTGALHLNNTGAIAFTDAGARSLQLAGNNSGANTLSAALGDGGAATSVVKRGAGTWILDGANSFSGAVTVDEGILRIASDSALGANSTGTSVRGGDGSTAALELAGGISILGEALSVAGRQGPVAAAPSLRNASGNNTWSGAVAGAAGGAYYNLASDAGTLTISGNLTLPTSFLRAWRLAGDGNGEVTGLILQGGTGTTGIVKEGAGTWTLSGQDAAPPSGANPATGPVLVRTGTLKVSDTLNPDAGELRGSTITVNGGATLDVADFDNYSLQVGQVLGGSGTVKATTLLAFDDNTINPGNTVVGTYQAIRQSSVINAPVAAPGTLTIDGNLSIQNVFAAPVGGLNFDLASVATIGAGVNDLIAISGDLSIDSTLGAVPVRINYLNNAIATGTYRLATYGGTLTGSNASFQLVNPTRGMSIDTSVSGQINLVKTAAPAANLTWTGDGGPNNWDTNVTANWNNGGPDVFFALDHVTFDDSGNNAAPITLTGLTTPASVTVNNPTKDYELAGAGKLSGATGITKSGAGVLTLSSTGGNDYSGTTAINAGTVRTGAANRLSPNSAVAIANAAGATLDLNGTSQTIASLAGGGAGGGAVTLGASASTVLTINGSANATFDGTISGTGGLTKDGSGTQTLGGANGYSGVTTIVHGTLRITSNGALGTTAGNTVVAGDTQTTEESIFTGRLELTNDITSAEPLSLAGRGVVGTDSNLAPHIVNVGGNNTLSGNITLTAPALAQSPAPSLGDDFTIESTAGTLTIGGNVSSALLAPRTLNLFGAGNGAVNGVINNSAATGQTNVRKDGAGTWTLGGANTYRGTTEVKAGVLLVNGTGGTGLTTVFSGATLGGTGTVGGSLVVDAGGALAPGASIGTLAVAGNATINGAYSVEVSGATIDTLSVTGGLALGAGSVLDIVGSLNGAVTHVIATYAPGSLSGSFADALDATSHGYSVVYGDTQLTLQELSGDANHDGVVDIFDVNVISDNWNTPGPVGDVNHDNIVDIFDVNVVSDNWALVATNGGGGVAAVPEPGSLALLGLGAAATLLGVRSRRRSVR